MVRSRALGAASRTHEALLNRSTSSFPLNITFSLYNIFVMITTQRSARLDAAFLALADPTRRAILARLTKGEATVMELAEPFDMSQPAISRHLKMLESAGLIARRADGTRRHCRLADTGLDDIDQWLAMLRKALDKNYERLDGLLAAMGSKRGEK
jgi:DNA-binding transcriptional ArsR family regulator